MIFLRELENETIDAMITDPPYSSGGSRLAEKQKTTGEKYVKSFSALKKFENFSGDNMDQHAWRSYTTDWLAEGHRVTKEGGVCAVFCDWRQLPTLTDCLQHADWLWRGIMVWDKVNSRPQKGRPAQTAEFVVWGSKGSLSTERDAKTINGVVSKSPVAMQKRYHQTQKPDEVMNHIVQICESGGIILDPFMGSGSTIIAAKKMGYGYLGVEKNQTYFEIAKKRIEDEEKQINIEECLK